ncbi:MAG TPA: hypothetical protein PK646_03175 [Bacillota bacterium]|jgi:hypothetical protein|nr:hypothetical protein [Fastidiosipila sp.]HPX93226.1 hypothetical protein [Bacillota bacterium]HQB81074.1 hypothetical protein [Bacillota bacterium]
MEDQEEKRNGEEDPKQPTPNPCAACDEDPAGCSGCGSHRKRVDTWWYIIAVLAVLLIAVLIVRFKSGST